MMIGLTTMQDGEVSGGALVILGLDEPDAEEKEGTHDLVVVGHGRIVKPKHGFLVAPQSVLGPADVESLGAAARDPRRCCADQPEHIDVAMADPRSFDEYLYEADTVSLEIDQKHVHAIVTMLLIGERAAAADYQAWLQPAAQAHSCRIASVRFIDDEGEDEVHQLQEFQEWQFPPGGLEEFLAAYRDRPRFVEVRVESARPMTVGSLLKAGRDVHALLLALRGGPLDVTSAANLLRAGRPHLLVGLQENDWFEVKSKPYELDAPNSRAETVAKIELAQAVARFANGDRAALLVIGLRSTRRDGSDVVDAVTPAKLTSLHSQRYRDVLDERIYPAVEGLAVHQVDLGTGKGLLIIEIPAQPPEYKPFLVHGAIIEGRTEGSFISIVRRRGEGSIPMAPSQIHAMLTAGRAFLRGEEPP
jgi:hypothetical protein